MFPGLINQAFNVLTYMSVSTLAGRHIEEMIKISKCEINYQNKNIMFTCVPIYLSFGESKNLENGG
jgi:hypothetical protein